ncbi:MAG: S-adenosylmethionine:tRNA ribosyltransferase-isomerase [Bacteroidales bacterium]|nr:S-adenosylmethionine:tRNA ribosyltransferase-isomerase [Bacteroidales bacterium]
MPYEEHASLTRKEALKKVIEFLTANNLEQLTGQTRLMIVPGYTYKMADAMFTNCTSPKARSFC